MTTRRWLLPFAALPLLQWAISFTAARTIHTVGTHDPAYYHVIAGNFAVGRGLVDTVLWQFLGTPAAVQRPAGGYWEVGWPLVLGALMRIFGHSQRASILICAALSGLLPPAAALVAWRAGKRAGPAFLAGLLVCLQGRLLVSNVTPDATVFYQLACLAGIAAALHALDGDLPPARLLTAGAVIALPAHVRGEGFVVAAAALPLLLFSGGETPRWRLRRTVWVALGIASLSMPFVLRDLVVFGRLVPESRSLRLWMTSYNDLYRFRSDPSPASFWAQGMPRILGLRRDALAAHLEQLAAQVPWPLLLLAAAGVLRRARSARTWSLVLFVALSLLAPCLVAPIIAQAHRFVINVLPILCVAASFGVFAVRDLLFFRSRILDALVLSAGTWASVAVLRGKTTLQTHLDGLAFYRDTPAFLADAGALAPLELRPDDVVLTLDPWRVAAVLDVAAVMCPLDGPAAVDALVERYRPRFVIVSSSFPALEQLVVRQRAHLRPVASLSDGSWYEWTGPVRRADGSVGHP